MSRPKPLKRDEIARFAPDQRSVRAFEKLFKDVSSLNTNSVQFNCDASLNVNDAVYIVDTQEVAAANASNITTSGVIGFVSNKETDITCDVTLNGVVDGFSSLSVGSTYFLDAIDGRITNIPVTTAGQVVISIGYALSETQLFVKIGSPIIRS